MTTQMGKLVGFEIALAALKNGCSATRAGWGSTGAKLQLDEGRLNLRFLGGNYERWFPTANDIMAEDWEVL